MLRLKSILVPTDFSPSSDDALTSACQWARSFSAEIHIFHALESHRPDLYPASLNLADLGSLPIALRVSAASELETRRRLATDKAVAVECSIKEGLTPAAMILEYAEANDIDLIAMSTHGRRGVPRMILGSVAEEVVQLSKCPVLTIVAATRSAHPPRPRRIVVPVDLSDHSKTAVAYAKHLAAAFEAELRLLHVVVQAPKPTCYDGIGLPNFVFTSPLLDRQVRSAMDSIYAEADGPSGHAELHLEHGVAVEQILRFASAHQTDLIVLASHGLTGLPHLLMGSVAERLVCRATCPVFTVKSFGKSLVASDRPRAIARSAPTGRPAAEETP
jgi:nucleotide-binding universal stress UspA family protein